MLISVHEVDVGRDDADAVLRVLQKDAVGVAAGHFVGDLEADEVAVREGLDHLIVDVVEVVGDVKEAVHVVDVVLPLLDLVQTDR